MEPTGLIDENWVCDTDIEIIDRQHKKIFQAMNNIYLAIENDELDGQLEKLIDELDYYCTEHFETEEGFAEKFEFPKKEELKKAHQFFKTTYYQLRARYKEQGSTKEEEKVKILHLHSVMRKWLKEHMTGLDYEVCSFLKKKMNA